MADEDNDEYVITWEAPVLEKPEFRLYYDERGNVITYSCEKLDGDYIVIDAMTFAEARPDVVVIDGRLIRSGSGAVISRYYPDKTGILCEVEDISIVTETEGQYWKLKTYEL